MASSWYNHTPYPVCIYMNAGYAGSATKIDPGRVLSYNSSWNDRMSSVRKAIYRGSTGTTPTSIPPGWYCS